MHLKAEIPRFPKRWSSRQSEHAFRRTVHSTEDDFQSRKRTEISLKLLVWVSKKEMERTLMDISLWSLKGVIKLGSKAEMASGDGSFVWIQHIFKFIACRVIHNKRSKFLSRQLCVPDLVFSVLKVSFLYVALRLTCCLGSLGRPWDVAKVQSSAT